MDDRDAPRAPDGARRRAACGARHLRSTPSGHAILAAACLALATLETACGEDGTQHGTPDATVLGSARIAWTLATSSGAPLSCHDLDIDDALVSIGGTERKVPCGEEQTTVFERLLPGPYPVFIKLHILGDAILATESGNIVVTGGSETALVLAFALDREGSALGDLVVRWRIDQDSAPVGCARVGGDRVFLDDLPGSRQTFTTSAPCSDGHTTIAGLAAGSYGVRLILRDSNGTTIASNALPTVLVREGETTTAPEVGFFTENSRPTHLLARWTINSSTATTACDALDADALIVKAFPTEETRQTASATVSCPAGQVLFDDFPPNDLPHRVTFQLYRDYFAVPPLPVLLTSTIVRDVLIPRGETATVSVDLRTP